MASSWRQHKSSCLAAFMPYSLQRVANFSQKESRSHSVCSNLYLIVLGRHTAESRVMIDGAEDVHQLTIS